MNWAAKEFRVLSLGGNRRNMRAVRLAERLATSRLPGACAETQRPKPPPEHVANLAQHTKREREAMLLRGSVAHCAGKPPQMLTLELRCMPGVGLA